MGRHPRETIVIVRLTTLAAVLAVSTSLAGCGDNTTADNATTTAPVETTAEGETPKANESNTAADQGTIDFIQKAGMSDMFEIEASKVALQRSQSKDVKSFAQMMIDAHTATSEAVKPIAASLQVSPPIQLDAEHQGMLEDLTKADAKDFDKKYLDQQTSAHSKALDLMKDYADDGDNADLKALAASTAPKVQEHLDQAKALDKGGADGTN
jgi:putative membrane protein